MSDKIEINIGDRYFNLIEMEYFDILSSGYQNIFKIQWELGSVNYESYTDLYDWLSDSELNIKVEDDKHLLLLRFVKEQIKP